MMERMVTMTKEDKVKRISDLNCDIWCMEVDIHLRKINTPEGHTFTNFTDRDFYALGRLKREFIRLSK